MSAAIKFATFADFAAPAAERQTRAKKRGIARSTFERERDRAREMVASGEWSEARPTTFVALWAIQHEGVYGVAPETLAAKARTSAASLAARLLRGSFESDPAAMADFMRWTWNREVEREKWRRANGRSGARITWGYQFSERAVVDYRLDLARAR